MSRPQYNSQGGFGKTHAYDEDAERENMSAGSEDIDIDFSVTESGRTVAHLIANLKEDDNMDYSISDSGRTVEKLVNALSSEKTNSSANSQMDFTISHSGRTIEEVSYDRAGMQPQTNQRSVPPSHVLTQSVAKKGPRIAMTSQNHPGSEDSGGNFIHGIMESPISHTPPSAMGTSYETRHFGKRLRSGSVSGRLRSASDLEDRGIIDRVQKGMLKDLIIAGDDALQEALDRYEKGDSSRLEEMIKSGVLAGRLTADVDLLGDLDLDFLTVEDTGLNDNIEPAVSIQGAVHSNTTHPQRSAHMVVTPSHPEDQEEGLGGTETTYLHLPDASEGAKLGETDDTRFRSNSLAFGVLQNEQMTYDTTYGRWVDHTELARNNSASGEPQQKIGIGKNLEDYKRSRSESSVRLSRAEERRRERQLKKEQKEKEKQLEKERRDRSKQQKKETRGRPKKDQPKLGRKPKQEKGSDNVDEEKKIVESGTGRPRSMSDPNLKTTLDENGLLHVERPNGWVGAYSPESRKLRIERFLKKRNHRVWTKSVKYDVRKNFADSRLRVKGRFVKKEDELLMRELMSLT